MSSIKDLLLLGDERLYQQSELVKQSELPQVRKWVVDLDMVIDDIRKTYNFGRAIAAPQLGIMKRLVYMKIDRPIVFINPEISYYSDEKFQLWDDCMSFPNLLVKVARHKKIKVKYLDEAWQSQELELSDDLSELLQHEIDHLNGILCTMRAVDSKSFKLRN